MKRAGIFAVLGMVLSGFGIALHPALKPTAPATKPTPPVVSPGLGADQEAANRELLALLNAEREKAMLPQLRFDGRIAHAARDHAHDDAAKDAAIKSADPDSLARLMHGGSDGSTVGDRLTRAGYAWSTCGENALYAVPGPPWGPNEVRPMYDVGAQAAVGRWMASPGHKANILGPYADFGGGFADCPDGTRYWVVAFGSPR